MVRRFLPPPGSAPSPSSRFQLVDRDYVPAPDPTTVMRRIAAEALILQDDAEAVLAGVARGDQLGVAAPRGGPLIRRFFALADQLPRACPTLRDRQLADALRTILIHHAMQLSTALDFVAVSGRSECIAHHIARIQGLGEPAILLEDYYRELRETG